MTNTMEFQPGVNRVEVIDHTGRAYVFWDEAAVFLSRQDGGRTLKIFITPVGQRGAEEK